MLYNHNALLGFLLFMQRAVRRLSETCIQEAAVELVVVPPASLKQK